MILVVFDLDNTLLRMTGYLGSDPWFRYHREKILRGDPDLHISSLDALYALQSVLFSFLPMTPVEPQIPQLIQAMQARGIPMLVMTSRNPCTADFAERELHRNGMNFTLNCPRLPALEGISHQPFEESPVLLRNGVFYTTGQHKGRMIEYLFHSMLAEGYSLSHIIAVDDSLEHCLQMKNAALPLPITIFLAQGAQLFSSRFDDRAASLCRQQLTQHLQEALH